MTEESKAATNLSRKFTNAAVSLILMWVGLFVCGVAVIILLRAWMWLWQQTEF